MEGGVKMEVLSQSQIDALLAKLLADTSVLPQSSVPKSTDGITEKNQSKSSVVSGL